MRYVRERLRWLIVGFGTALAMPGLLIMAMGEAIYPDDGDVFENFFGG